MPFIAWIRHPQSMPKNSAEARKKKEFDARLIKQYRFVQGPGARIVFVDPNGNAKKPRVVETDALRLDLGARSFDKNGGQTPVLDKKIAETLAAFAK